MLRHSECGSQPAQTTSGRSAESGRSCHTRASAAPVSSGKRIAPWSLSFQVAPRSSDHITVGPQWPYWMPASTRGCSRRGVDGDRRDLLGEQVRAVDGPGAAVVVTAREPQPLARADGEQVGHGAPPEFDGSTGRP